MRDETLVEPIAVQEFFVDGFDDYEVKDGILTCAGFRTQRVTLASGEQLRTVVVRIVMPVSNLAQVIGNALAAAKGLNLPPIMPPIIPRKACN